ncbi:hypothetical protein E2320_015401 [Naja naja]|nr:hypothetical protein E2320_015401 [Naja naja]
MDDESIKRCPQPPEADGDKDQRTVTINPCHMGKAFKVMNELRSKRLLCDVVIVAEDIEIEAHRIVLAACSPYFCAMFTGDMTESKAKKIEIKDVDGLTLSKLIDYIYTAEVEVTEENVQSFVLNENLDFHYDLPFLNFQFFGTEQHFPEVMLGEEFLSLSLDQVCSLISSDKLTVSSEEKVFEAVISWINYDKESRLEHMAKLMEHVRLPLLPRDYLVQTVEEEALIKNNNTCKDFLIEAMKYHLLPLDQRQLIKNPRTKPRTPVSLPKLMMIAIGLASVEAYNYKVNEWFFVAPMNTRRSSVGVGVVEGVCSVNGLLYVVGGDDGSCNLASVEYYNPVTDKWTLLPSNMSTGRSYAGVAVIHKPL